MKQLAWITALMLVASTASPEDNWKPPTREQMVKVQQAYGEMAAELENTHYALDAAKRHIYDLEHMTHCVFWQVRDQTMLTD